MEEKWDWILSSSLDGTLVGQLNGFLNTCGKIKCERAILKSILDRLRKLHEHYDGTH
jgi:hypothetical protein